MDSLRQKRKQKERDEGTIGFSVPTEFPVNQTEQRSVRSSSGRRYDYSLREGEKYTNSIYQQMPPTSTTAPPPKITINTSMTSTIPAPPLAYFSSAHHENTPKSASAKSKARQQKQSQAEIHQLWEDEYVRDHLMKGHMNYCFAWLDNGVCPQYMVGGCCCYVHAYPNSWTDEMIRKHGVIKTYMDDLYRGCDILELVGRGKKSTALMNSKGTASIIAEAIDAKIDALEQQ